MNNDRLRRALVARALTVEAVAERAEVDPKTVQRWLAGRTPHARHRWAVAALLGRDEADLWPEVSNQHRGADEGELVTVYAHRADVPANLWRELLEQTRRQIAILAYAALFLPEQHLDLIDLLRAKAAGGCQVRLALGDPTSPKLLERGTEETFGTGIVSRAELALKHYAPLADCPGVEVRMHGTTLYNSLFRFDDALLVNTHVWGLSAYSAPLLHLRRQSDGGLFDTYAQSFGAVWAQAVPAYQTGSRS
jgi:transcriptional regulator with XRE-family HTH domain